VESTPAGGRQLAYPGSEKNKCFCQIRDMPLPGLTALAPECLTVAAKSSPLSEGTARKIRVEEAARMARWSQRTLYRHLPYFKSHLLTRPGKTRGNRVIDYADFVAYLERRAQGLTNLTPERRGEDFTEGPDSQVVPTRTPTRKGELEQEPQKE
jgi:hypothetical protein